MLLNYQIINFPVEISINKQFATFRFLSLIKLSFFYGTYTFIYLNKLNKTVLKLN
jgi:hypothetical protein